MKKRITFMIVAALILQIPAAAKKEAVKWEQIKSKNGITVYRKEDPSSNYLVFKGKGTVNKEMFLVLSVIGDINNLTKWVNRLKSAKLVKQINDMELILYNVIDIPWPLQNRDVVLKTKAIYDLKTDSVRIRGRGIKHGKYPKQSGIVRIPYMRNTWSLKPIKKGKATWVEFQVQVDPGGIIPAWIANMTSKDVPYKTISSLRKRVAKGKYSRSVLKKIDRFAKKNNLYEKYTKKYGNDYIKDEAWYESHYSLVK